MDYFDELNNAIKNTLGNHKVQYQLSYLDEITKLATIVIENTPKLNLQEYFTEVSIDKSLQIVSDFFKTINPKYSLMFQNILKEKDIYNGNDDYTVKFYRILEDKKGRKKNNRSQTRKDGSVRIDYSETLDDIYTISHETVHKFSQPKNQESLIKDFFGEVSTILIEFLLQDYLFENTEYNPDELLIRKNNRLLATYDDACAILFENILLNLYIENNNCLTEDILLDYLNNLDKDSKLYHILSTNGKKYLDDIVSKGYLQFNQRKRYVIGLVLASEFHDRIKNNPSNKSQLDILIDILSNTDLSISDDIKKLIDLDILFVKTGIISDTEIKKLTSYYFEEIKDILKFADKSNKIK